MSDERALAERLGFTRDQQALEIGFDDDTDAALRDSVEEVTGQELLDEDSDEEADVVLLWFREDDGDLTDTLVDAGSRLVEGGTVWLLTPKVGRDGYVEPGDITEAADTAGFNAMKSVAAGPDWSGTKLAAGRH
ncbi:hypothetical protein UO65_4556 [Actinokineospora spheciospongiae]|uniref:DUF3052 domain-containing protein n=1 Tax=Actinokineospora spheciospongiae TaxID=909613 RepID=W7IUP0_9PSEU|nr:DUF3052 domain-containing protein [Actinokineospora spheciospongiae]EWC60116.1 hypothetical protein UO65_4556 [Actinokineospora spheciospongiae]PWW56091.1 hypothetical protein DFQ13_11124 [Actinokineospora spheciospongiae]